MKSLTNKQKALLLFGVVLLGVLIGWFLTKSQSAPEPPVAPEPTIVQPDKPVATSTKSMIGTSVEGRVIESYTFGTGETNLLFIGGVHGGYEWNSILLAYNMIDEFQTNPALVPVDITVHIIPNLNPDGLFTATGLEGEFVAADIPARDIHSTGIGRFNANDVDLNRNFGCKWTPESSWRGQTVSAGTAAFSEPEAQALRQYVLDTNPDAAVFWHSRANNVYASECENGVLPQTLTLMNAYATAGDYGAVPVFDAYPITGDAEGWLASIGIPAVTVELQTRDSIEWTRNFAGVKATLQLYQD
jgi:hypothetical protein